MSDTKPHQICCPCADRVSDLEAERDALRAEVAKLVVEGAAWKAQVEAARKMASASLDDQYEASLAHDVLAAMDGAKP